MLALFWMVACLLHGQVIQAKANLDDDPANWRTCVKPSCDPGGSGVPKFVDDTPVTNVTRDGHAMRFDVEGPKDTNALWYYYLGEFVEGANQGLIDLWVYLPSADVHAQALEYDAFEYAGKVRYMFGHQCDRLGTGKWDVWDMLHGSWVATEVPCSLTFNEWHHLQIGFHRIIGDVSDCAGYPCQYYDSITIDGHVNAVNMVEPAGPYPPAWGLGNNAGLNIQLDVGGTAATLTEFVDKAGLLFYGF